MKKPEFVFELRACRWAELAWPPTGEAETVLVGRQLGTRHRRWDTVIIECDAAGLDQRANFGSEHLHDDLLHVVRHAPRDWMWYRDALPEPGYPWRYVREAVHEAGDRNIIKTRKRNGRIELRRRFAYPEWIDRIIAIEHKPDLDASAAEALANQLSYDVALGLADEVWLATRATDRAIAPALFEAIPVEAGIVQIDPDSLEGDVIWHPRSLTPGKTGTRILERPNGTHRDYSAARFEYVSSEQKAAIRRAIGERAYERGWRSAIDSMRPDCRHFELAESTLTHEPHCRSKGRAQSGAECSGDCPSFEPEPPGWRTRGWPIEGGPGRGVRRLLERQRLRHR